MARLSRSTMVAELSPPAKCQGPEAPSNEAAQAAGFEQAVAAVVELAGSEPCQRKNPSALIRLRIFMPSCLVHALEQLRSGRSAMTARELHVLADAAFLFTSARPIVEAFLEQELSIVELVNNTLQPELNEVAKSVVLLSSLQCLPHTPEALVLFKHEVPSIRWMSVLCMAGYLSLSVPEVETLTNHAVPDASMRFACESGLQRRIRHLQALSASMWDMTERADSCQALREATPAPAGFVNLCGALVRCKTNGGRTPQNQLMQAHFVSTPAIKSAVHSAALALSTSRCVLVSGPTGCGKSCLVHQLAAVTNHDDVLELYMDANTDSRALLGSYMCSQTPGEFFWQPGPLSQAVRTGRWIVLDNLHLAPADVLTTLETLISSRVLHVPQRGEVIPAHPEFRLIATVQTGTSEHAEQVRHVLPRAVLSEWWHVKLPPVQRHEQVQVLAGRFPSVSALLYPLIALAHLVHVAIWPPNTSPSTNEPQVVVQPQEQDLLWDPWAAAVHKAMMCESLRPGELLLSVSRAPGMHDLVKVCSRLAALGGTAASLQHVYGVQPSSTTRSQMVSLPVDARTSMLVEAADVFCGCTVGMEAKRKQLRAMAHVLGLPPEDGEGVLVQKAAINLQAGTFCVGRARLPCTKSLSGPTSHDILMGMSGKSSKFAHTTHSSQAMQSIAVAVQMSEPLLLVGESGTGKTTIIQHVAEQVGQEVVAINFSSQSESSDLLGGMKPVQVGATLMSLHRKFTQLLQNTWPAGKNADFLTRVHKFVRDENWPKLIEAFAVALKKVSHTKTASNDNERPAKKARLSDDTRKQWDEFASEMEIAKRTLTVSTQGFAFEFVEGALVHALRTGQWLLLDEINMAPPQVLESIMCVLDSSAAGLSLLDQPGSQRLHRHPGFRIFGAMNPATDTGKRHLPAQIKALFTEVHIPEAQNREDLVPIINAYLPGASLPEHTLDGIVEFFREARELASGLSDGSSSPAYNLRTLARSIQYVCHAASLHGMQRALFDGFAMFFAGMLEASSATAVVELLKQHVLQGNTEPPLPSVTRSLPRALAQRTERFINVEGYWIVCGNEPLPDEGGPSVQDFILTKTVRSHLRAVARALTMQPQCPILLQGPTSSGKTTLVEHIARTTGHKTIRINNHQHTDLQEYLGAYSADDHGNLVFHEGALVRAARNGDWVILDELNLAPTDVLEALNRLLDDNHELFVPELQETIKPHPQFMLFGTQNPAGAYAGRKMLSRALRSRFLQIMIPDLPSRELTTVLEQRCAIPASHAAKLVSVMNELRILRSHGNVFAGCHGLITPRDIFRWASRQGLSHEELAMHGHSLLAERLRTQDERNQVLRILVDITKTKFDPADAYAREGQALQAELQQVVDKAEQSELVHQVRHVVWTKTLQRMYYLSKQALEHQEAVLLVGETGAGKTTLAQTLAFVRSQQLLTISCNMHTEAADFLGGYRPARNRNKAFSEFVASYSELARSPEICTHGALPPPPNELDTHQIATSLQALERAVKSMLQPGKSDAVARLLEATRQNAAAACIPFMWEDGPLVTAMRQGCLLLVDEINLAEDAVLERLNSVLEPGRTLLLAEKGGPSAEQIVAAEGFRVIATMNPGGDHGKRELSPALSNRFTQVWVSDIDDSEDVFKLVRKHLPAAAGCEEIAGKMVRFWEWYSNLEVMGKSKLSNRDLLAWCQFICEMHNSLGLLPAFLHGIFLVLIDGLGSGAVADEHTVRNLSVQYLHGSTEACHKHDLELAACFDSCKLPTAGPQEGVSDDGMKSGETLWGIAPFLVPVGLNYDPHLKHLYHLDAPTTARNTFRLLRAMQVPKPILLEGSPGVGKTSLITAIAATMGHELIRVNLSEQTEMADLLGADLPAPDGTAGAFQWAPGPLLRAVRSGAWVILDELNLASQAVLEGLNSVLDHRREIFIPELDETVRCAANFRVFAAQNPVQEGGGRKALPKSFLNRFSRITLELLKPEDLLVILQQSYPQLPVSCLECMVNTVGGLHEAINVRRALGRTGAPWEFNLRDASRWCDLISAANISSEAHAVALSGHYAAMLFSHKMQTKADKQQAEQLIVECWRTHAMHDVFEKHLRSPATASVKLSAESVRIGWCELSRTGQVATLPPGARAEGARTAACSASGLELACASVPAVEWIATACKLGWMAVVMSPDVQRATRVVRMLAAACSQPLIEITMSDTSDISDLLGGFEQMDFVRQLRGALAQVQHVTVLMVKDILSSGDYSTHSSQHILKQLQQVQRLEIGTDESVMIQKAPMTVQELSKGVSDLRAVHAQVQWSPSVADALGDVLVAAEAAVAEAVAMLKGGKVVSTGGRFVWVDGLLLSAIERGHWVLMLHANTCSAAVLDRLNSLLEPSGSLYINECGACAGGPRIVKPHPNFRLLIVMDPSEGGLSRAMRNRGVEIFLDAHKLDNDPSAQLTLEEVNHAAIPGTVLPDWLQTQLSSSKHLFRDALWQRQHTAQLLAAMRCLVESGASPLDSLIAAQKLVPPAEDGIPDFTVDRLAESFSMFNLRSQGCENTCSEHSKLSLASSCSSLVAFPPLESSRNSVTWQVASSLLRVPNVLISQLVCTCIVMPQHRASAVHCLPPPLVTLPDVARQQRGSTASCINDAYASVQLLLTSVSAGTSVCVYNQLLQDWDELQHYIPKNAQLAANDNVQHIECWYKSTIKASQPEKVTKMHQLPEELQPPFSAALASCEQLDALLEQVLSKAAEAGSKTRTVADLSAALCSGKLSAAPLLLHPVVPVVVRVLCSFLSLQKAALSDVLCNAEHSLVLLQDLRQLQLAMAHILHISISNVWEDLPSSVSQRLLFLLLNISELWDAFKGLQGSVPCLRLESTQSELCSFSTELSNAVTSLQLHSHAPEASLLRTRTGHLKLPAAPKQCEQWLLLQQLSACFEPLHLTTADHALATVRAAVQNWESLCCADAETASAAEKEQKLRSAAAVLACSQSSKSMLSEGAALLLAEMIGPAERPQTSDRESFCFEVVSRTKDSVQQILQSCQSPKHFAPAAEALAMQPLAPEHLMHPTGIEFQAALSQLDILQQSPIIQGCLALVSIAPQVPDIDTQQILQPVLSSCKQSSVVAPLMSAALQVVSWSSAQDNQNVRIKAAHVARWHASKSTLCLFRTPFKFRGTSLSELLPWKLRDALSHPSELPGHCAASFAICQPLPLCLSHMLAPSGVTLQALPSCKAALSQTLHSLLSLLASTQMQRPPPVLLHVAVITATAAQALHAFSRLVGEELDELARLLAQVAKAVCTAHLAGLPDVVDMCCSAVEPACAAMQASSLPGLPEGCAVVRELVQCIQRVVCETASWQGTPSVSPMDTPPWLLAKVGQVAVELSAWRASLLKPPPGFDPAMMAVEECHHVRYVSDAFVAPWLRVCRASQSVPLLSDTTQEIAALELQLKQAETKCSELQTSCVPRPDPPQYLELVSAIDKCEQTMLAAARDISISVLDTTASQSDFEAAAATRLVSQCEKQAASLANWADCIEESFPLYADQYSPFVLALRDAHTGLSMLRTALQQHVQQHSTPVLHDSTLLRSCFQYPITSSHREIGLQSLQDAVTACSSPEAISAVKEAVLQRLTGASVPEKLLHALPKTLAVQLQLKGHMMQLQTCALLRSPQAQEMLQSALRDVITLWNVGKELQEELQAREESIYKSSRTEQITIRSEDEELDVEVSEAVSRATSLFADLMATPDAMDTADGSASASVKEDASSLVIEQLSVMLRDTEMQKVIVESHKCALSRVTAQCNRVNSPPDLVAPPSHTTTVTDGLCTAGMQLLEACGGYSTADMAGASISACVQRVLASLSQLNAAQTGHSGVVDVFQPCLAEMMLAVAPVQNLCSTVEALLDRFPEQPMLEKLQTICKRILGMSAHGSLKDAMIGVELLVANVDEWQKHSASVKEQTSLAQHQGPIAALAARWRSLELKSWSESMSKALSRVESGAYVHWFHLMSVCFPSNGSTPEISKTLPVIEQFLQSSSMGQFEARLDLLKLCCIHCSVLVSSGQHKFAELATFLQNVHSYYAQHVHAVQQILEGTLGTIRKEMKDFVTLQRWDHHGAHDLKLMIEKAQRKLATCNKRTQAAASELITPALASFASSIGIELVRRLANSSADEPKSEAAPDAAVGAATTALASNTLPRLVQSVLGLSAWWARMVEVPAVVNTWMASECTVLKQGQQVYSGAADLAIDLGPDLSDTSCWRNRDHSKLTARLLAIVLEPATGEGTASALLPQSQTLPAAFQGVSQAASSLFDEAGSLADRMSSVWSHDGQKGSRSMRKKALTDVVKLLTSHGFSTSKVAVPVHERSQESWWMRKQQPHIPSRVLAAMPSLHCTQHSSPGYLTREAWPVAFECFQQVMGAVGCLQRACKDNLHSDISQREVSQMCSIAEHAWYLLRRQHHVVHDGCEQLCVLEHSVELLETATANADCFRSSTDHAKLQTQLEALEHGIDELQLFMQQLQTLCPPSSTLRSKSLAQAFNKAKQALTGLLESLGAAQERLNAAVAAATPLKRSNAACDVPSQPSVFTATLLEAMNATAEVLKDCCTVVHDTGSCTVAEVVLLAPQGSLAVRDIYPSWIRLESLTEQIVAGVLRTQAEGPSADDHNSRDTAVQEFANCVEVTLQNTLLWAQEAVKAHADGSGTSAPLAVSVLSACAQTPSLEKLCAALACCAGFAGKLVGSDAQVLALIRQLRGVLPMVRAVLIALRAAVVHAVMLQMALSQLTLVTLAVFNAYVKEGFGEGTSEEQDGQDGEGTGTFKQEQGTGLGDGDTADAQDVSNQIENEDQIMGAQQQGMHEDEPEGHEDKGEDNEKGDAEGVEMEQDFDGEMHDGELEVEGEEEDAAEAEKELEKEMGDAGDDAEVLDEKMWLGEDEGGEGEENENRKDAGATDSKINSKSNEDSRKLVAGGEDEQEEEKGEGDQADGSQENADDQNKADDEGGLMDEGEVAEQMEGQDNVAPQPEQPELQVPEDLNLEDDAIGEGEEDTGGADAAAQEEDEPVNTSDAKKAEAAEDTEMQQDDDIAAQEADGKNTDEDDDAHDATAEDATQAATGQAEEEAEKEDPEADPEAQRVDSAQLQKDSDAGAADQSIAGPQGGQITAAPDAQPEGAGASESAAAFDDKKDDQAQKPRSEAQQEPSEQEADEEDKDNTGATEAQAQEKGANSGAADAPLQHGIQETGDAEPEAAACQAGVQRQRANPLHDLGSAQEQWRKDFDIVQDATDVDEEMGDTQTDEADAAAGQAMRFATSEDNNTKEQALAAATQEQAEEQAGAGADPDGEEGKAMEAQEPDADEEMQVEPSAVGDPTMQSTGQQDRPDQDDQMMKDNPNVEDTRHAGQLDDASGPDRLDEGNFAAVETHHVDVEMVSEAITEVQHDTETNVQRDLSAETDSARGYELWQKCSASTAGLTGELIEQLRLVLQPTLASKLSGGYKAGKRLNMKKLIRYIASSFRQDKIWMRRTVPNQRQYQVLLAIDETKSMKVAECEAPCIMHPDVQENRCDWCAMEALTLMTSALSRLEVGTMGVAAYGGPSGTRVLHDLSQPWTDESAASVLGGLRFDADNTLEHTPLLDLLKTAGDLFTAETHRASGSAVATVPSQLLLIVADGHFHERTALQQAVRQVGCDSSGEGPLIVMIILDAAKESILDLQQVVFENGEPVFMRYLDGFPFPYYMVLRDIQRLPHLLADLLRQWIQVCCG